MLLDRSDPCVVENPSTGDLYHEISCVYPSLSFLYTKYEIDYDPYPMLQAMRSMPMIPFVCIAIYMVAIFSGQRYMKNKERFNWRTSMAAWNLGLAIFSLIGTCRLAPYVFRILTTKSIEEMFCHDARQTFAGGSTGLWVQLFALSKLPELIDTFFVVIHKKKLIFLHWFHHMSVVIMAWFSYISEQPSGIHFCLMNYGVHTVMYFYYFLMTVKKHPKWFHPIIITFLQISQMVVGVCLAASGAYFHYFSSSNCKVDRNNLILCMSIYGSYLFLFCQFFVTRYFVKVKKVKSKKTAPKLQSKKQA